jgi:hypothetical protein
MSIVDWLLPEYDTEMAATRRMLERVPLDEPGWKPHEKSMTIHYLAFLCASLPGWVANTLERTELDIVPPEGKSWGDDAPGSILEMLVLFDRLVAEGRRALEGATEERLQVPWTLERGPLTLLTQPRWKVCRETVINHMVLSSACT